MCRMIWPKAVVVMVFESTLHNTAVCYSESQVIHSIDSASLADLGGGQYHVCGQSATSNGALIFSA